MISRHAWDSMVSNGQIANGVHWAAIVFADVWTTREQFATSVVRVDNHPIG